MGLAVHAGQYVLVINIGLNIKRVAVDMIIIPECIVVIWGPAISENIQDLKWNTPVELVICISDLEW